MCQKSVQKLGLRSCLLIYIQENDLACLSNDSSLPDPEFVLVTPKCLLWQTMKTLMK